jgi:hypothetical protein
MIEGFDHVGTDHVCNVCSCDFTDDEGGIQGYFGILPVAFCPTCYASMCDMVEQDSEREWEGLTDQEIKALAKPPDGTAIPMTGRMWIFVGDIEDKLKEKNGYE